MAVEWEGAFGDLPVDGLNRHRAVISGLALADFFSAGQPRGRGVWRYPAGVYKTPY